MRGGFNYRSIYISIVSYIYILLGGWGRVRWLNLVGDVMSFCSHTCIYCINTDEGLLFLTSDYNKLIIFLPQIHKNNHLSPILIKGTQSTLGPR